MDRVDRESVLAWLAGLPKGHWLEVMTAACTQRPTRPDGELHFTIANIWRFNAEEPWGVELVAVEDVAHYNGRFAAEDCSVIRATTCRACRNRVGSWARVVRCPVCGESLSCY
jgi:hypothetical protein